MAPTLMSISLVKLAGTVVLPVRQLGRPECSVPAQTSSLGRRGRTTPEAGLMPRRGSSTRTALRGSPEPIEISGAEDSPPPFALTSSRRRVNVLIGAAGTEKHLQQFRHAWEPQFVARWRFRLAPSATVARQLGRRFTPQQERREMAEESKRALTCSPVASRTEHALIVHDASLVGPPHW